MTAHRLPGEPLCVRCRRHASAVVGMEPLCTQHAAAATRKAARAAAEAAWWKDMFTPTPKSPYAGDPEWQAAVREKLTDIPGETAGDSFLRRLSAIRRQYEIEAAWEAAAS